jgi:hypothetical protein
MHHAWCRLTRAEQAADALEMALAAERRIH